ncbi:Pfs NB-ARC and TPR domain protein [Penicillium herquei]|nr:Pfs NB-ARC and TPR domain protein [Penicillium herquei]
MKSGEDRDRLMRLEGVVGFEMEGAGVWDNIPCVIIKGVCGYADSHKSKDWQSYAAGVGASAAKVFLAFMAPAASVQEG